jgi:hypothetical protein
MQKTQPRTSFTPDSLAKFAALFEEVWSELVLNEVVKPDANEPSRARLAQRVFRLARSPWSDIQMKQLLTRAFRNEATRLQRVN